MGSALEMVEDGYNFTTGSDGSHPDCPHCDSGDGVDPGCEMRDSDVDDAKCRTCGKPVRIYCNIVREYEAYALVPEENDA